MTLNAILSPLKIVNFNEILHYCNGRCHDITCSHRKCYVMCGHNIIYDMTLSTRLKHGIGADLIFFMLYLCYRKTVPERNTL